MNWPFGRGTAGAWRSLTGGQFDARFANRALHHRLQGGAAVRTEAGTIYAFDDVQREIPAARQLRHDRELIDTLRHRHIGIDDPNVAPAIAQGEPIQIADLEEEPPLL